MESQGHDARMAAKRDSPFRRDACLQQALISDVQVTVEMLSLHAARSAMVQLLSDTTGKYVAPIESDCGCADALEQHLAVVQQQSETATSTSRCRRSLTRSTSMCSFAC